MEKDLLKSLDLPCNYNLTEYDILLSFYILQLQLCDEEPSCNTKTLKKSYVANLLCFECDNYG